MQCFELIFFCSVSLLLSLSGKKKLELNNNSAAGHSFFIKAFTQRRFRSKQEKRTRRQKQSWRSLAFCIWFWELRAREEKEKSFLLSLSLAVSPYIISCQRAHINSHMKVCVGKEKKKRVAPSLSENGKGKKPLFVFVLNDDASSLAHGLAELQRAIDDVVRAKVLDLAVSGCGHGRRPEL